MPEIDLEYLKLCTNIHLFDNEKLTAYQSELPLPLTLDRPRNRADKMVKPKFKGGLRPELMLEYVP